MIHKLQSIILAVALVVISAGAAVTDQMRTENVSFNRAGGKMLVSANINLDSVILKSNQQVFLTPILTGSNDQSVVLPTILVTGRSMHYAYERGTMRGLKEYRKKYDILKEVRRYNGHSQTVEYSAATAMKPWMRTERISLQFRYDTCGCGVYSGSQLGQPFDTIINPMLNMRVAYITPRVTDLPVAVHEGLARVQFEVNRSELHDTPYQCKNGQRIDNRDQLKVIYDSIEYALTDPNVEIARIQIIGSASPESSYEHNKELATARSRALAEYIGNYVGKKYSLPSDIADFEAVAENWAEFREQVVKAKDITDQQRNDLLALIDRPAFSPSDYDAKEQELKTSPRFRDLYARKILPEWFPHLRATKFRISTRLKPMGDPQLAEIIKVSPEKMSLNQMMRVARLYPEGSEDFDKVIETALMYYPDNEEANLNAAASSIRRAEFERAEKLLLKAGESREAINARAIVVANKGEFEEARRLFESIKELPEAQKNLLLLGDD